MFDQVVECGHGRRGLSRRRETQLPETGPSNFARIVADKVDGSSSEVNVQMVTETLGSRITVHTSKIAGGGQQQHTFVGSNVGWVGSRLGKSGSGSNNPTPLSRGGIDAARGKEEPVFRGALGKLSSLAIREDSKLTRRDVDDRPVQVWNRVNSHPGVLW